MEGYLCSPSAPCPAPMEATESYLSQGWWLSLFWEVTIELYEQPLSGKRPCLITVPVSKQTSNKKQPDGSYKRESLPTETSEPSR